MNTKAQNLETALISGDLSVLTPQERVALYKPVRKPSLKVWAYVKRQLTEREQWEADENGRVRFEYREIAIFLDPIPKPITPRLKVTCRCLYPAFEFDSWHLAGEEDEDEDAPF